MNEPTASQNALLEANRNRARFSGHGKSLGDAGYRDDSDKLAKAGQSLSISPAPGGFGDIRVGCSWSKVRMASTGFIGRLLGRTAVRDVDLDLGCLYELQSGHRGAVQAFGGRHGAYDAPPYIHLSEDERTGAREGDDEFMHINGGHWPDIKRALIYAYIYDGRLDWASIKPVVTVQIPGQKPIEISPQVSHSHLSLCVIASLDNVRGGIVFKSHGEYYPGHLEMDRAFGYGLEWDDGVK